jgi:hypothetical protein
MLRPDFAGEYVLRPPQGQTIRAVTSGEDVALKHHTDGSIGVALDAKRLYSVRFA